MLSHLQLASSECLNGDSRQWSTVNLAFLPVAYVVVFFNLFCYDSVCVSSVVLMCKKIKRPTQRQIGLIVCLTLRFGDSFEPLPIHSQTISLGTAS